MLINPWLLDRCLQTIPTNKHLDSTMLKNVPTSVSYDDKLPSGVHRDADEGLTDEAVSGRETCNRSLSGNFAEGLQLEAQLSC